MKLSACIEMVFRELPFGERIEKVKAAGLGAFEFWGWGNKDLDEIERKKNELGLEVATFAIQGALMTDPSQVGKFVEGVEKTIPVARKLGTTVLLVTTGNERTDPFVANAPSDAGPYVARLLRDLSRAQQHASIVQCLKAAAPLVEKAGITLALEPLNILVNHKGYYLYSSHEAIEIVKEVGSPSVKILYDIYHQQITEGHLIPTIEQYISHIGHFHLADVPGRHEPGTGEINYRNVLRKIRDLGYQGFVGLEYAPTKDHTQTLREIMALLD